MDEREARVNHLKTTANMPKQMLALRILRPLLPCPTGVLLPTIMHKRRNSATQPQFNARTPKSKLGKSKRPEERSPVRFQFSQLNASSSEDDIDVFDECNTPSRLRARQGIRQRQPPAITARAWVVADTLTGKVLWNRNGRSILPPASITKIMTSICVLKLCRDNRVNIEEEEVEVTKKAAKTTGTTANIKENDRFSIVELLYGLMLPSGNDAAVALAQFMGIHYLGSGTPISAFVAYMNRTAREIGAKDTEFKNPHGMDSDGHHSTCYDIAKISSHAMKDRKCVFRKIVRTKEFTCRPRGPHSREIVWKNTNKLLSRDRSIIGVKTGVTRGAGPCLCSCAKFSNGLELLVITLNSSSRQCRWQEHSLMYKFARANLGISKLAKGPTRRATKSQSKTTRVDMSAQQQFTQFHHYKFDLLC